MRHPNPHTNEPNPEPDIAETFQTGSWEFTPQVAAVFDEHVRASVPYYNTIQDLITETTDWLLPANGLIADLGAATGTTTHQILTRHPERNIHAHLYDNQPAMLAQATTRLTHQIATGHVTIHPNRIQDPPLQHHQADLTLILFTLQFLPWQDRQTTLQLARHHSNNTGALIIAEKVRPLDTRWAEIANDTSHDWKETHGITNNAIRAKAKALRGVLTPHPLNQLNKAITNAGWDTPEILFRWHQWVVIGAFAQPLQ